MPDKESQSIEGLLWTLLTDMQYKSSQTYSLGGRKLSTVAIKALHVAIQLDDIHIYNIMVYSNSTGAFVAFTFSCFYF